MFGTDTYSFRVTPKQEYKRFYNMITDEDIEAMLSIDPNMTKENMLNRVFGHFFSNN